MQSTLQVLVLLVLAALTAVAFRAACHNYRLAQTARSEAPFAVDAGLDEVPAASVCPRTWPTTAASTQQARLYMQYARDKATQQQLLAEVVLVIGGSLVGASVLTALGNGTWIFAAGLVVVAGGLLLRLRHGYWRAVSSYYAAQIPPGTPT